MVDCDSHPPAPPKKVLGEDSPFPHGDAFVKMGTLIFSDLEGWGIKPPVIKLSPKTLHCSRRPRLIVSANTIKFDRQAIRLFPAFAHLEQLKKMPKVTELTLYITA